MSKIICSAAIRGARKIIDMAEESYEEALKKYGADHVGFFSQYRLLSAGDLQYAGRQGGKTGRYEGYLSGVQQADAAGGDSRYLAALSGPGT